MTTLITHTDPDGTIKGRCDAKCHDAKFPICKCICAGLNHGKGRNQAIHNTQIHADLIPPAADHTKLNIWHGQYQIFEGGKP